MVMRRRVGKAEDVESARARYVNVTTSILEEKPTS